MRPRTADIFATVLCVFMAACSREQTPLEPVGAIAKEIEAQWQPALVHPDAPAIINSVLTDWFGNENIHDGNTGHLNDIYGHEPNLQAVRIRRDQLPHGFVPTVPGIQFLILQTDDRSDAPLMGEKRSDIGVRFDWFEVVNPDTVKVVFCLLQYADRARIGGWSVTYEVTRMGSTWKAICQGIMT